MKNKKDKLEAIVNSWKYNYLQKSLKWQEDEISIINSGWINPSKAWVTLTLADKKMTLEIEKEKYELHP
jgi:hypothetical protein